MSWLSNIFGGAKKRRKHKRIKGSYVEPRKRAGRAKRHRKRQGTGVLWM